MDCQADGYLTVIVCSPLDPANSFFPKFRNQEIDKDEKKARIFIPDPIRFGFHFNSLYYGKSC